ncbi:MAG: PIN domain-containing protein [Oscillospiraceae bacterium]|nr:PIN domain-containing protein [Oscillospiraceae bacterium]
MKVYLDCCCYCRLFDDSTQEQVRAEIDAILTIYELHGLGLISIVGSEALNDEIGCISDSAKRRRILDDYYVVDEIVKFNDSVDLRSAQIQAQSNIHVYDSFHIACAEETSAEVMLTTDYRLIKMASRIDLRVKVMNPTDYINRYWNGGDS